MNTIFGKEFEQYKKELESGLVTLYHFERDGISADLNTRYNKVVEIPNFYTEIYCNISAQKWMINVRFNSFSIYGIEYRCYDDIERSFFIENFIKAARHFHQKDAVFNDIKNRSDLDSKSFYDLISEEIEPYTPRWFLRAKYARINFIEKF